MDFAIRFNEGSDGGPKWDWFPLMFTFRLWPFMFMGIVSLLPKFSIWWHWGLGWEPVNNAPHVWIDRQRTVREWVREANS